MDLEGYVRRELKKGKKKEEILEQLKNFILNIKFNDNHNYQENAEKIAEAVIEEVEKTEKEISDEFVKILLSFPKANVKMGEMGVGSRGIGDFFVHERITKIASLGAEATILPKEHDDAGIIKTENGNFIVIAVDGTHSRLSEYPFIAGFHVARAALRDVLVKGAIPIALLDDLHLGDDGDVGRLFDFVAGVSCVSELSGVPLVTGSTLRIGGDMVIGERMVSCVGAVGIIKDKNLIKARKNIKIGDKILMTSGAGGGTIATTAIYSGNFDVIKETLNIDFIKACKALYESKILEKIDAMLDVTNGGIRGDAYEVIKTINEKKDENKGKIMEINEKIEKIIEILRNDYKEFFYNNSDPFKVLIATILSQRTKDEKTKIAEEKLFKEISSPHDALNIPVEKIEELIKDVGFYKTKAKRIKEISKILVEKYNGKVPENIDDLLKLKGVGRKTANCVLLFAYKKNAIPVDTHVHRISNRIGLVSTKTPEETEIQLRKIPEKYWKFINYLFVQHGQKVCNPKNPKCNECKISKICDYYRTNNKAAGLKFYESKIENLINKKVLEMLKNLDIDYLGVSIDSLMLFVPPENCNDVMNVIKGAGVKVDVVGEVVNGGKVILVDKNENEKELKPLFRESGYTKIKKVIGEKTPKEFEEMKKNVDNAYKEAVKKREKILKFIKK